MKKYSSARPGTATDRETLDAAEVPDSLPGLFYVTAHLLIVCESTYSACRIANCKKSTEIKKFGPRNSSKGKVEYIGILGDDFKLFVAYFFQLFLLISTPTQTDAHQADLKTGRDCLPVRKFLLLTAI